MYKNSISYSHEQSGIYGDEACHLFQEKVNPRSGIKHF